MDKDSSKKEARVPLAITITFKDHSLECRRPLQQLRRTLPCFETLQKCFDFEIYPELTLNGRIHYHGTVWYKDYIKWQRSLRHKFINAWGHVLLKPIDDMSKWYEYVRKAWVENKIIFKLDNGITEKNYSLIYVKPQKLILTLKERVKNHMEYMKAHDLEMEALEESTNEMIQDVLEL